LWKPEIQTVEGERDWEGETEVVRAFENGRDVLEERDVVWKRERKERPREIDVLFNRLIIRTFQLVFSAETVFFSHDQSANCVFQPAYQHDPTGQSWTAEQRERVGLQWVNTEESRSWNRRSSQ
jgi:hypothetical protein